MLWLKPFELQLDAVFEEAKQKVAYFPKPLNELGLTYLAKFDIRQKHSTKNYVCYLLPFWIAETIQVHANSNTNTTTLPISIPAPLLQSLPELSHRLGVANIFCMLHFFIQDDLMDTPNLSADQLHDLIPLSQLFWNEFVSICGENVGDHSSFWSYYKQFLSEWASAVYNEAGADYLFQQPTAIAGKVSPIKISLIAMLLKLDCMYMLPDLLHQLDQALIVLQMNDDLTDWKEDMVEHSYNCLLSFIRNEAVEHHQALFSDKVTPIQVQQAIYDQDVLTRYAQYAESSFTDVPSLFLSSSLIEFRNYLIAQLYQAASSVHEARNTLLQGSLMYYIQKDLTSS